MDRIRIGCFSNGYLKTIAETPWRLFEEFKYKGIQA